MTPILNPTYYNIIGQQIGFYLLTNVADTKIGDFIVINFPPGTDPNDNTGHIAMINRKPALITSTKPIIKNYHQLIVNIIDQTTNPHRPYDTRNKINSATGLGTGNFRIYANNQSHIMGYAWSMNTKSRFIPRSINGILIGRLSIKNWKINSLDTLLTS